MTKKTRAQKLADYLQGSWLIECHFCGAQHEFTFDESGESKEDASEQIYKMGWREIPSNKFQVIAPACAECAKKSSIR